MIGSLEKPAAPDGARITEPGVYAVPLELHHGDCCEGPSASSSTARTLFTASPKHVWAHSPLNPDRIPFNVTDAMVRGSAAHHLIGGEGQFFQHFAIRPERFRDWRTNDAKAWRAEQEAAGKAVLTPADAEAIRGMAAELAAHPLVQAGILNGYVERSLIWWDESLGLWLKSRPDNVIPTATDFADLKVMSSVHPDMIAKKIEEFRLDMQAAMVRRACRFLLGQEMTSYLLVCVEATPPHCVEIVEMDPDDIERGDQDLEVALRMFRRCLDTGHWPGPGGDRVDGYRIHRPEWGLRKAEARRHFLLESLGGTE